MLEGCKSAQERWGGVHSIIDRWLEQRRELIEGFVWLRERGDFTPTDTPMIQRVCEQLVDYVSAGHFEVYEQLAVEAEAFRDDTALQCLKQLLPEIQATTEIAVEFNDKFDTKEHTNSLLTELPFALQALMLVMSDRFRLEDQLIEELHDVHSEKSL
jgi:regulator of sigma D